MWLPVSTLAALCILLEVADAAGPSDNELELIFRERSRTDWEDAWHKEKYTRCRDTLIRHLYWACDKDIYRLTRRSGQEQNDYQQDSNEIDEFPWKSPKRAKQLLRLRRGTSRRSGSSITRECCSSSGCTWEEYAEYCPTNKRYTTYV